MTLVQFPAGKQTATGYLALPSRGRGEGVLLLHAWWGLNDFMKRVADRLAAEGYVVLAPDLYDGQVAQTIDEAKRLRSASNKGPIPKQKLLKAALDYLEEKTGKQKHGIGVIGFSMGAHLALWLAENHPEGIAAMVTFYGARQGNYGSMHAAYLCHFAEQDPYVSANATSGLEASLRAAGKDSEFHTYSGTGHWFFEEDRPDAYNPGAASEAWERTVAFLQKHLG